jgi:mycofactocin precursor
MAPTATELLDPAEVSVVEDKAKAGEVSDVRPDELIAADQLVEEISIDGMCGVY